MAVKGMSAASLFLSALLLCSQVTFVLSVEGRFFFLAFMDPSSNINPNSGIQQIHVSGSMNKDTKVRIQVLPLNVTYMYQLNTANGWGKTLNVFPDLAGPSGTKLPVSVVVSSETANISVQVHKAEDGTSGGYLALPITSESMKYYIASYTPRGPSQGFSIASPYHTCVTMYRQDGPIETREADYSLNPGQVIHVNSSGDFTGRFLQSNRPIVVFGGLDCAYVAADTPSVQKCDHIIEQLHPVSEFGQTFTAASFQGRNPSTGFQLRVVATIRTTVSWAEYEFDSTTNTVKAPVVKTPQVVTRGNFIELKAGRGSNNPVVVVLTCSAACLVMQYGESNDMTSQGGENGVKPDSTMITVPGINHYTSDITFSTSQLYSKGGNVSLENVNGITVIAKKADVAKLMLDGQPLTSALTGAKMIEYDYLRLPTTAGVTAPTDKYTVIYGGLATPGFHRVTCSDPTVLYTVMVYGHAPTSSPSESEGYAYLGGMRYTSKTNTPQFAGPYFDFSQPAGEVGITPPVGNPGPGPSTPVVPTEFPKHQSVWEGHFYILNPHLNDLKTQNCSEAYQRYYLEKRLYPMMERVNTLVRGSCPAGCNITLTHLQYYSQYTDGIIRFLVSASGAGSTAMSDVYDCMYIATNYLSEIKNWVPTNYKDETSFLVPEEYYNKGCDPLHMKKPRFESYYYGWNCPYYGGVLGSSDATVVKASAMFLVCLAAVASLFQIRR